MSTKGYRGSSDLALAVRYICKNGTQFDLAKLALPYSEGYIPALGQPVTVRMEVTVNPPPGPGGRGSAGPVVSMTRDLTLLALKYPAETNLYEAAQDALAGVIPSALTDPPYDWPANWPTGRALITHLLTNVRFSWDEVEPGTMVILNVKSRVKDGRVETVDASDYVLYTEACLLPLNPPETLPAKPNPTTADVGLQDSTTIQGNILAGFNKTCQAFLLLKFEEEADTREWLAGLTSPNGSRLATITDTATVTRFKQALKDPDQESGAAVWVGVGLTFSGIEAMQHQWADDLRHLEEDRPGHETFREYITAFREGPGERARLLGDIDDSEPAKWHFGRPDGERIDAILTVAGDDPAEWKRQVDAQVDFAERLGLKVVGDERTDVERGPARGFEHFGFRDGISQPGVRGYSPPAAEDNDEDADHPGSRIVDKEQFILGAEPLKWMKDGSFQVFRKLAQDVRAWREQIRSIAGRLPVKDEVGEELLAAKLLGRWTSGTSTAKAPVRDTHPKLISGDPESDNRGADNRFDYANDPHGLRTPRFAHTRTQFPREDFKKNRIMRRGATYGPVFDPVADADEEADDIRGLLFNGFLANLIDQFETLQQRMKATTKDAVPDALLAMRTKDKRFRLPRIGGEKEDEDARAFDLHQFVRTRGAIYAFAPSVEVLRTLAAGKGDTLRLDDPCPFCEQ